MKKILFGMMAVLASNFVLAQSGSVKCTRCDFPLEPVGCSYGTCLKQKLNEASKSELDQIFSPDIADGIIKVRGSGNNASLEAYKQYFGRESFDELARSLELYGSSRNNMYSRGEKSTYSSPASSGSHSSSSTPHDFADPLYFGENKSSVEGYNAEVLDDLAKKVTSDINCFVVIHGYANDYGGVSSRNRELSRKRALAVKEYLVDHGADAKRLLTIGHGEDNPLGSNATADGRSKNRRVSLNLKQR